MAELAHLVSRVEKDADYLELRRFEATTPGPGSARRRDLTRALASRYADEFEEVAPPSLADAIDFRDPSATVARSRRYFADHATALLSEIADRIGNDPLYVELSNAERLLIDPHEKSKVPPPEDSSFGAIDGLNRRFNQRYGRDFEVVRYAFALRNPDQVKNLMSRTSAFPYATFESSAPFYAAITWDRTTYLMATNDPAARPLRYQSYLEGVKAYLNCELAFQ